MLKELRAYCIGADIHSCIGTVAIVASAAGEMNLGNGCSTVGELQKESRYLIVIDFNIEHNSAGQ